MAVSWAHHERHGAWLLRHAELRGFRADERELLVALVRGQRGAWPRVALGGIERARAATARSLCVLLRLAVLLEPLDVEGLPTIEASPEVLCLRAGPEWCRLHPWVCDALVAECALLEREGVRPAVRVEFPCA
jgi:exopolyphosphatase/guanosine-5'-triphosphate,3'-diphosphate pyrophosphatase